MQEIKQRAEKMQTENQGNVNKSLIFLSEKITNAFDLVIELKGLLEPCLTCEALTLKEEEELPEAQADDPRKSPIEQVIDKDAKRIGDIGDILYQIIVSIRL